MSTRRTFTVKYKKRILSEVRDAVVLGDVKKILMREGLYSSHLVNWKREETMGILRTPPLGRNRQRYQRELMAEKIQELMRDIKRLKAQLKKAQLLLQLQKDVTKLSNPPVSLDLDRSRPKPRSENVIDTDDVNCPHLAEGSPAPQESCRNLF